VNSVGYEREGKRYYKHNIPWTNYHDYALAEGKDIDTARVPEGRKDIALVTRTKVPIPEVGDAAPEISANKWVNLKEPATLAGLRGKVVLVEFWATWCGPCIQAIPHLNELHEKNAGKKFQLLSFVVEGHKTMDKFLARTPVKYPIGLESGSLDAYGITGIPHAFVIDQAGKIVWHGHSASPEMEKAIERALEKAELGSGKN
jgi:thiol-disulfide isomerase/thioredoxin